MNRLTPIKRYFEAIGVIVLLATITAIITIKEMLNNSFDNLFISLPIGLFHSGLVIVATFLIVAVMSVAYSPFNSFVRKERIIRTIERNLIYLDVYEVVKDNLVSVPKIKVDEKQNEIIIEFTLSSFRSKLERRINELSTCLPKNLIVNTALIDEAQTKLIINYIDLTKEQRITIKTPEDFTRKVNSLKYDELFVDGKTIWSLRVCPHALITGTSGSGKSYWTINNLICSALIKKWDVSIIDFKSQYHAFDEVCSTAYSVEEIATELDKLSDELHARKEVMKELLKQDPNTLAYENGYPIKLIIVEGYLALVSAITDKKLAQHIESVLMEIATTGRSLGFCLVMITQQSSSTTIPTSLRSSLSFRMLFGTPNQAIWTTTFEDKSAPNINIKYDKGSGVATFDCVKMFSFKGITFSYTLNDFIKSLKSL